MTSNGTIAPAGYSARIDWVDYAKGICIVMVVMMHSTLGVQEAAGVTGFMDYVVAFARPFRMPDFFLISGLFLARVINRDWRTYLDRKVVHFAYFYILWLLIQGAFKWPILAVNEGPEAVVEAVLLALIEPFGTLWFIYLLPVFFVVAKLARPLPPLLVLAVAAVLEMSHLHTGWVIIDEFAARIVYFLIGWYAAEYIFHFAEKLAVRPWLALFGLLIWALINGTAVWFEVAQWPGLSLILGLIGAGAVISVAVLLSRGDYVMPLRYAGEHSIVVYLAFFLPMAVTRLLLLKTGIITDIGIISLIVMSVAVMTPLVFYWLIKDTRLRFLFERPDWARLKPPPRLSPAE